MAAWLRCLRVGEIFVRDPESGEIAEVLLRKADSAYHARRALWSFVRFPDVLLRDPYLGYPDGAVVPLPPLYDALLALGARLFASSQQGFEVGLQGARHGLEQQDTARTVSCRGRAIFWQPEV